MPAATSELGKRKRKKKVLDEDFVDIDDSSNKMGEDDERLELPEDDNDLGVHSTSSSSSRSSKSKQTVSSKKKKKKQSSSTSTISASSSSSEASPVSSPIQQLFELHAPSSSTRVSNSTIRMNSDNEEHASEEEESPTSTVPKPVLVSPTALFLPQVDQESIKSSSSSVPIATTASSSNSKRRFKTKSTPVSTSGATSSPTASTGSPSSDSDRKVVPRRTLVLVNQPSLSSAPTTSVSSSSSPTNVGTLNNLNPIKTMALPLNQSLTNNSTSQERVPPSSNSIHSPYNVDDWSFITNRNGITVEFKKSRDAAFVSSFPKVLYTLTWKHKYDLKIVTEDPVFQGVSNKVMIANVQVDLVMGRDFTLPSYEPSKSTKQKASSSGEGEENGRKKKSHKKPSDVETITLTSASKENDNSIILRFGINRTYCSKRFNYAPFRLKIDYTGPTPFTIYSPIFHSFAKKLNEFTVKNVNEILKRTDESLVLPLENADEMLTPFQSVFCDTIPNASPAPSTTIPTSQVIFVVQNGSTQSNSTSNTVTSDTNKIHEDASLLLSLGGLFK
ncbi:hypothetical protein FDP41_003275 [Naegleria fowleri]|uniref:Uncharacterized protein n=1 Tax=Naegleria fowleri TaxID=5763 RepID=A0A6A5BJ69_NAEFO|nr:uncharacterized protein FDP41_003275 [Naegleria fowleri]KAF0977953.1 hypothetical protein FDP41_003275 [Naegleria fowleri]CAG4714828.1 unnamed protein product [Naegleria fowleri]